MDLPLSLQVQWMMPQWLVDTAERLEYESQGAAVGRFHPNGNGRNVRAPTVA